MHSAAGVRLFLTPVHSVFLLPSRRILSFIDLSGSPVSRFLARLPSPTIPLPPPRRLLVRFRCRFLAAVLRPRPVRPTRRRDPFRFFSIEKTRYRGRNAAGRTRVLLIGVSCTQTIDSRDKGPTATAAAQAYL